jgi:hypothetical protein
MPLSLDLTGRRRLPEAASLSSRSHGLLSRVCPVLNAGIADEAFFPNEFSTIS